MIDEDKLTQFNDLMGYYQIVTSELDMPDLEVIDKYHGLTQIEDQFHEMKGTLETRPIYVRTSEHIQAHLMICFMALTMMRVMQHKIKAVLPPRGADCCWTYGLPGKRLARALADWKWTSFRGTTTACSTWAQRISRCKKLCQKKPQTLGGLGVSRLGGGKLGL